MEPFVGQLLLVPYNFAPVGWAFCAGQILPISQNTALFSLLGTYYGGDGRSNFALPDMRGRVAMGQGQGPGLGDYVIGESSGTETVTLLTPQMPLHTHAPQGVAQHGNQSSPSGFALSDAVNGSNSPIDLYATGNPTVAMSPSAIGPAGGGLPHNNLMQYEVLNWVIALQGVFPARQ
jgi:microcystin-dependent protein